MPLVGYSPWQDAANYGSGLGETLGKLLIGLPQQRAELAMQRQQFPLQQQLLQAQVQEANLRPGMQQQALAIRSLQEQLAAERQNAQMEYLKAREDQIQRDEDRKDKAPAVKPPTSAQDYTQGRAAVTDYAHNLGIQQKVDPSKTPIGVDPSLMQGALQSTMGSQSPYSDTMGFLQKAGAALQAILQTNQVPNMATNWMGTVRQLPTTHPEVSTNAYQLRLPQVPSSVSAPSTNSTPAITAVNPQTKQRIVSYDGGNSWQPLTQ